MCGPGAWAQGRAASASACAGSGVAAGGGVEEAGSAASAAAAFSRPPVTDSPANGAFASTEPSSAARIWATVAAGAFAASSAAAPLTCGAAIDVPFA